MPEVTITIEGLDHLVKQLDKAPALVRRIAGDAIEKGVHIIHGGVAKYPAQIAPGWWAAHTTPKQRAYFFWALRQGLIKGSRTGTLGRRWTTKVDRNRLEGRVGNVTKYARFVQDEERQAGFHRGRWQTAQDVAEKARPDIVRIFEQANGQLVRELAE